MKNLSRSFIKEQTATSALIYFHHPHQTHPPIFLFFSFDLRYYIDKGCLRGLATMYDEQETKSIEKSLRYIASHVRVNGREILKHHDISPLQFVALQWVGDKDGITIGELATRLYLAHSTTTDIVDKLESGNYVRRDRSDKDKRLVLVSMEEKGREIIQQVIDKRIDYIAKITANLDEAERKILPAALEHVLRESERITYE
jgi:Transcriptional regulators